MAETRGPGLYDPRNEHDSCGVGFVVNIKGRKSHDIIRRGLEILVNLDHRGAVGADPLVGDGAGCLIQTPDALLRHWCEERGLTLPPPARYAVAMCFLPREEKARAFAVAHMERFVRVEGQELLAWREVPTDTTGLGKRVVETMPSIVQAIVCASPDIADQDAFERKILAIRKQTLNRVSNLAERHGLPGLRDFYIPSFSTRTVVYKGLLLAPQIGTFYEICATRSACRRWRWCTSASRPTPSRRGGWRTRTGISATTARSTRCAATSTGSRRAARRCRRP